MRRRIGLMVVGPALVGSLFSFAPAAAGVTVVQASGTAVAGACVGDLVGFVGLSDSGQIQTGAQWTFVGWRLSASACATAFPAVVASASMTCSSSPYPNNWCRVGGSGGTFTMWRVDATRWDFELCVLGGACTKAKSVPGARLP